MRKIAIVAALWTALTVAALTAPIGAWIGWRAAADLPTDEQMRAIVAVAKPGYEGGAEFDRAPYLSGTPFPDDPGVLWNGYEEYGAGYAEARFSGTAGDLGGMADRLRAAGWRVGDPSQDELTAASGDWRLVVRPAYDVGESAAARVHRAQPVRVAVLAAVFWLVGALLGAGLAWLARGLIGLGVLGLALLSFHTLLVSVYLVADVVEYWGTGPFPLLWEPVMTILVRPVTLIGGSLFLVWVAGVLIHRLTGRASAAVG
ncbi:hypothetical protein [Actinoplanes sp. URMC 104]|uniref:hypothetical protein n=1 Tax=Actinoplanes sp. URMC 104 TaxID=3423409 RepID=UPI003F1DDF2B